MTDTKLSLVEKVAACIRDARALPGTKPVARLSDVDRRAADAAIAAVFDHLMEPSEGMVRRGYIVSEHMAFVGDESVAKEMRTIWQAMLTKAKEEAGL